MEPRWRWILENGAGGLVAVAPLPFRVGRAAGLEFVLSSDSVSSVHAEIVRDGEDLRVRDLGSSKGTFVNGARIYQGALHDGDLIHFGSGEAFHIWREPWHKELDIYWQGNMVGHVSVLGIETIEVVPASTGSPAVVRSAKLTGRWLRRTSVSADAFARSVMEGVQPEVVVDGVDEVGVGLFQSRVGLFSLLEEGEALLYFRP